MLKIRLSRTGKKGQPSFRIVVQEKASAVKSGKVVEYLGYYYPAANPKEFKPNLERVNYWLSVGAQPSDTLATLLKKEGLQGMEKFIGPRKKKGKKKNAVEEEPQAATPTPASEQAPPEAPAQAPEEKPAKEASEQAPAEEPAQVPEEKPAKEAGEQAPPEAPSEATETK